MLYSFILDRDSGNLTMQSSVNTLATDMLGGTVHIGALEGGKALMTTNYFSGSVFYVPLESDGVTFSNTSQQLVTFTGKGPYPQQDSSHPHEVRLINVKLLHTTNLPS
jgi:6-phosphogluconolactonase (cycloisomerase 2 family)